ncbi:MarC family protein [Halodesulfovibrio spirochaetisodalis]|nr:MarC family protein [Halodesulfovibrio spirochaetisodalis]
MPTSMMLTVFTETFVKFFFVLTPFFVVSMFLALTVDMPKDKQRKTALRTTFAVIVASFTLFFFGNTLFAIFGITLDAFRIGAGALLFLSAVHLIQGTKTPIKNPDDIEDGDISVVPLAIPVVIGPATIGTLLIMGAQITDTTTRIVSSFGLLAAILTVGCLLLMAPHIQRLIGTIGLSILSKISGLILSALSAQIVFTGIKNFLF